jgi:predicted nucleic acid-binding protein
MILVDSSVLINFFKANSTDAAVKFEKVVQGNIPFGITPFTYQEILLGAASEMEFGLLKEYLDTQVFYYLREGNDSYAGAARIYFKCRKSGITVRSTIDLLIVQTALEHGLLLLHDDKDFIAIGTIVPELVMY